MWFCSAHLSQSTEIRTVLEEIAQHVSIPKVVLREVTVL